jgi:hypothetical protein
VLPYAKPQPCWRVAECGKRDRTDDELCHVRVSSQGGLGRERTCSSLQSPPRCEGMRAMRTPSRGARTQGPREAKAALNPATAEADRQSSTRRALFLGRAPLREWDRRSLLQRRGWRGASPEPWPMPSAELRSAGANAVRREHAGTRLSPETIWHSTKNCRLVTVPAFRRVEAPS